MFKSIILATIFIIASYPSWAEPGHDNHGHDHSAPELIITPITPAKLKASEENEVVLFIQDKKAQPVDVSQFEVVHTKPLHLLIAEPGLSDYHHEHPVQRATGQYAFTFTPNTACSYRIWADVQLKGSHQHYIPIDLSGAEACRELNQRTVSLETTSQGYDFKLTLENDLQVGEAVMTSLAISKDGKPVDFLEPVMGSFAHMVGFYEDYESIAHIHPMGEEPSEGTARGGPSLRFHIEPEQAGRLKLFAQVQIDGRQVFAPFDVIVK